MVKLEGDYIGGKCPRQDAESLVLFSNTTGEDLFRISRFFFF